jgi:hypothetical protein
VRPAQASNTSVNCYMRWMIARLGSGIAAMDYNKLNCYNAKLPSSERNMVPSNIQTILASFFIIRPAAPRSNLCRI